MDSIVDLMVIKDSLQDIELDIIKLNDPLKIESMEDLIHSIEKTINLFTQK